MDDKIPEGVYILKNGVFYCRAHSGSRLSATLDGTYDPPCFWAVHDAHAAKKDPVFLFPVDFLMYGDPDHE